LDAHDPDRLNSSSHARHADEALRAIGEDTPQINPRELAHRHFDQPELLAPRQPELPAPVGLDATVPESHQAKRAPHPPFR
jgi:hypothetical protein